MGVLSGDCCSEDSFPVFLSPLFHKGSFCSVLPLGLNTAEPLVIGLHLLSLLRKASIVCGVWLPCGFWRFEPRSSDS